MKKPTPGQNPHAVATPEICTRQFYQHMPISAAIYRAVDDGQDFVFTGFNAAAEAFEGLSSEDVLGRRVTEVFPGIEALGLLDVFREVYRTGEPQRQPVSLYKDNRLMGWRDNTVFKLVTGEIVAVYADGTAEKQAEESLRLSEEKYRTIFNHTTDAIFVHDANTGVILEVNDAMLHMFECSSTTDVVGKTADLFSQGAPPYGVAEAVGWIAKARDKGHVSFKWRARTLTGRLFWAQNVLSFLQIAGEDRIIAIVRDISEAQKKHTLALQLEQVQKLESLGVLAGGIAHDFNNLLMAISGNAELAHFDIAADSPAQENLKNILSSSRRAADLCAQLLAYSGKGHFVKTRLDISSLTRGIIDLLRVSISKRVRLHLDLDPQLPPVLADPTQLRQILMNLVINGSEAIGEQDKDGSVTVTTGVRDLDEAAFEHMTFTAHNPPGPRCFIEVTDTGCGMPPETLKRIFEPFFTTKFTGRGLGMAAVIGIVRGHGGALQVHSEVGKGSRFTVYLPVAGDTSALYERPDEDDDTWRGTGLVLLVDDEPAVQSTSGRMLARLGFEVIKANNGQDAVEIFGKRHTELTYVLMDLMMPKLGGEAARQQMLAIDPDARIVLSSGYNKHELSADDLGGPITFIQKPYDLTTLRCALQRALKHDPYRRSLPTPKR